MIAKGQIGQIKVGLTISEADRLIKGLRKAVGEADEFGFGGGGTAYLYYFKEELIFSLIPKLDTDSILFIVAAHKNLKTINNLSAKSSVAELQKIYPELKFELDLMNGWEIFTDNSNNWEFTFTTQDENRIGKYPEPDLPSKPFQMSTKSNWITLR